MLALGDQRLWVLWRKLKVKITLSREHVLASIQRILFDELKSAHADTYTQDTHVLSHPRA